MDHDEIWRHVHEQRRALAATLADLDQDDWATPSLCEGWTVREVAAHVIRSPATTPRDLAVAVVRARGSFNRLVDQDARRAARRPVPEILAEYQKYDGSRRRPLGTASLDPLLDVLVHTQDIVVPLGRRHPMPVEAAVAASRRARQVAFVFGGRRRLAGVTLRAADADLEYGAGPVVEGPTEAILLLLTGRTTAAVPRLSGPGVVRLGSE